MNFDIFENINFQNLEKLYELTKEGRNISDIKINYSRDHTYVRENLNFLFENDILSSGRGIKIIKDKKNFENFN